MQSMPMKLLRVRQVGHERILAVPKNLAEKLRASYVKVDMDDAGRLIYTPVPEVS